jgi:sterol desaturase/sphingolipid hydroxylase (fatty acid hydroxylase superfamily)
MLDLILPHFTHTSPFDNYDIPWYSTLAVSFVQLATVLFAFGSFIKYVTRNSRTLQPGAIPRQKTSSPIGLVVVNYLQVVIINAYVTHLVLKGRTNMTWDISFTPAFFANALSTMFVMALIDDFMYYWYHKAVHRIHWLYHNIHYIHHEDNAPNDPLTSPYYDHPIDFFMGTVISYSSIFFIPDTWVGAAILFLLCKATSAVMEHCGKSIKFAIGEFVLFDSQFHDTHHQYGPCNYGQNFPIFDVLFNTARFK